MGARDGREKLREGQKAPAFALRGAAAEHRTLESILSQGPALVAFFKVSCPTCQLTLPFLERFHRQADGRFQVVGISQDSEQHTKAFAGEYGIGFPLLLDEAEQGYPVSNGYGITHVPSIYWIDSSGTIQEFQEGFGKQDIENLGKRAAVEVFHPGEDVPVWKAG